MNDNNLIKAQLWADVYGGTIKNGHSVAAATDRANEAVKEYEGVFNKAIELSKDGDSGGASNPHVALWKIIQEIFSRVMFGRWPSNKTREQIILDCVDAVMKAVISHEEWLDTTFSRPTRDQLLESYKKIESLQSSLAEKDEQISRLKKTVFDYKEREDAKIKELKDNIKSCEACMVEMGERLKEREATVGSLSDLLSEKDKKISALEERVKQDKRREESMFFVGDRIKAVGKDSVSPVFGTVVNADSFILHVKPHNPEVLPDYMRHSSIIGVVRNDCERVLEFPSRNHLVKDVQTNDASNTPNPFASNLHPFVSENADKLAEASKDGGLFISNQIPLNPSRRSGNTTRIADAIIQALFNGEKVLVRDHYNSRESNRELLSKVEHRLVNEHGIKWSAVCMEVECLGGDVTIWLENRTGENNK